MPSDLSGEVWYKVVGVVNDLAAVVFAHRLSREQAEKVAKALSGDTELQRIEIRLERNDSSAPP